MDTPFEAFLKRHDGSAWATARNALLPSTHEVDRTATAIWFYFFPLALADTFAQSGNPEQLTRELRLEGNCHLAGQHESSHWFLYGHRYWPAVKATIIKRAESAEPLSSVDLATMIRGLAKEVASSVAAKEPLLTGIVSVGLMTLQQIGLAAFRQGPGIVQLPPGFAKKSPDEILAGRRKNDRQGVMGIFRGLKARYTVTFDERRDDARFPIIYQQHLTTASANDTREYVAGARRCHEGPIPVQCRTASCGTCWVGILGGAERLSAVDDMEARRMKEFGYITSTESTPAIRLACMAVASGNVTIVIPTWNGFVGKAGLGA